MAKSPADGYTLLIRGAFVTITALLHKNDPRRDLILIAIFANLPHALVAEPRFQG